jgi:2-dehydro-3-deoxyglucarate aldolase/4-hydroxy-2-oxoheptanedioate aldolase
MRTAFPVVRPESADVPPLGAIVTLPDPRILEMCVEAGCDWLFVDCEHGAIVPAELGRVLPGARGVPVLVRIPANEEYFVKQALDAGCDGVVCPQVGDAETVRRLVRWSKYPPDGARSVGIGRAHGYGLRFGEHLAEANAATSLVVQIENRRAVENIAEIVAEPGLGGVFIGPYDLSASLGKPGQVSDPEVLDAVRRVVDACAAAGIPVGQFFGTHTAFVAAPERDRYDYAAIGIDTALLTAAVSTELRAARHVIT